MPLSDLNRMSGMELARKIAARNITSVGAVEASLTHIQETEPSLNAFVQVNADGALAAARQADRDAGDHRPNTA